MNVTERAHERCGRRAAGLLEPEDTVLVLGHGAALRWCLSAAGWPTLVLLRPDADLGAAQVLPAAAALAAATVVLALGAVTADGAALLDAAAAAVLAQAADAGLARYLLAPAGPEPAITPNVPSSQISAVVTSRGTYRPEMVRRHLTDGDAPLDIIPLT